MGYLPQLKEGPAQAFGAHFLHDFSKKCSLFNTVSIEKVSISYLFSFSRYKKNVLLSSYLDS